MEQGIVAPFGRQRERQRRVDPVAQALAQFGTREILDSARASAVQFPGQGTTNPAADEIPPCGPGGEHHRGLAARMDLPIHRTVIRQAEAVHAGRPECHFQGKPHRQSGEVRLRGGGQGGIESNGTRVQHAGGNRNDDDAGTQGTAPGLHRDAMRLLPRDAGDRRVAADIGGHGGEGVLGEGADAAGDNQVGAVQLVGSPVPQRKRGGVRHVNHRTFPVLHRNGPGIFCHSRGYGGKRRVVLFGEDRVRRGGVCRPGCVVGGVFRRGGLASVDEGAFGAECVGGQQSFPGGAGDRDQRVAFRGVQPHRAVVEPIPAQLRWARGVGTATHTTGCFQHYGAQAAMS